MQLHFLGAAGTVTGSNFLLSDERGYGVLIDMGMFQGSADLERMNYKPINFDPRDVHSILLTHAHLDHCGRLPLLLHHGFSGKVYMTQATKELTEIVLMDAAKIMDRDPQKAILYTEADVADFLGMAEIVSYDEEVDLGGIKATYRDAGHILGSASIEVTDTKTNEIIAFSGDLGNTPEDLVRPTQYIKRADKVVMESTYGDRSHPEEDAGAVIQSEINEIEKSGGTLLIPSFSIERTQAILHKIAHLKKDKKIKMETPFFMDSPMAKRVTDVYKSHPELFGQEIESDFKSGDPFSFKNLFVIGSGKESKKLESDNEAKVIIAGSGMMNGGRIVNHAKHYLPMDSTRLLIVGFQGEGTLGREIEEGNKQVKIEGQSVEVKANINSLHSMSAHADQPKLLNWIKQIDGTKEVFLVHGEDGPREVLSGEIKKLGIDKVHMPHVDESFSV